MTLQISESYTTTGEQAAIDVGPAKVVSFSVKSNNGDADVDVEVQLTENGSWKKEKVAIDEETVFVTIGPIVGIRLDIDGLGTSSTVTLEVLGISR